MQKGFASLFVLIGLLSAVSIAAVAYYLSNNHPKPASNTVIDQKSTPTPSKNPQELILLSNAWSLGTKIFSDKKVNISFEYPAYFEIKEIDVKKENAQWQEKYKNNPDVKQPLYTSTFYTVFNTPNQESAASKEFCDNKMSASVQKYDNTQNLSLYDFIADSHKSYPGDGRTESFETYKKDLKSTALPKEGSYVFEGIVGENPVKTVYFTNRGEVYTFGLIGNCNTGGQYTPDANKVFESMLKSIKFNQIYQSPI